MGWAAGALPALPLAVALLIAIPALGSRIGVGMASMKMLEGDARQPELMTDLQTKFFLVVGFTDGAVIKRHSRGGKRFYLDLDASRLTMMGIGMATAVREKFSSQAAPDVLAGRRQIAESQGRQFQVVLDDALRDYIDRQQKIRPRRHVMAPFASSLDEFDSRYRELAK